MAVEDLTGQKFGHLTVIKRGENYHRHSRWWCQCDCGNTELILVLGANLKNGGTQSCGCLRKERAKTWGTNLGRNNRKHFGCMICGSDKHFAKGMCHACYERTRRQKIRYKNEMKGECLC